MGDIELNRDEEDAHMGAVMQKGHPGSEVFGEMYLPGYPYAADTFGPDNKPMPRERALRKRNIQTNPRGLTNLLVIDVDHPDGIVRALEDRRGWQPTWVAENPSNGHAHAAWRIKAPVASTEFARRKPLHLAADVHEGLRASSDADKSYGGFMTKNPLHEDWEVLWGPQDALEGYELADLANHLRDAGFMPPFGWRKARQKDLTGLGRNCTLFETLREWAYPQINNHWNDLNGLGHVIENAALQMNVDLFETDPLPVTEVRHMARSVTRFIGRSDMWRNGKAASDARFREIQTRRNAKGNAVKKKKAEERTAMLQQLIEEHGND